MLDPEEIIQEMSVTQRDAEAGLPPRGPSTAAVRAQAIEKCRYSHAAMVDLIVANPWIHQDQLATHFGRTPAWISTVMQTDAFRALLAARREELIDPELRATIKERFEAVVHQSLRVLAAKLSKPDINAIPDNLALRAAELGARSLGFGLPSSPPAPPALTPTHLTELADRLVALQGKARHPETLDAQDARVIAEE